MKFWIGGAAQTANMAVIWAQLYIDGKGYGVHAYVVPIRDPQTHKLLPGVLIGDCGPKSGLNGIDNGFILLDRVRIPKNYQLDRISGVDENGKFRTLIENDDKRFGLHLSALSGGRYMISTNCCAIATQAVTIGIRYTTERRQFKVGDNKEETLLFDYPLTKRRMMPLLAQSLVYYTASMRYIFEWDKNQKNILEPSHPAIEKLHAISSVMKAKSSWFAAQCARECREMLGGNGYCGYSKLGVLYNDNDINLTWEGDNHVLIQQTTKYVLEEVQKILQKGKKTNNDLLKFVENVKNVLYSLQASLFPSLENL